MVVLVSWFVVLFGNNGSNGWTLDVDANTIFAKPVLLEFRFSRNQMRAKNQCGADGSNKSLKGKEKGD